MDVRHRGPTRPPMWTTLHLACCPNPVGHKGRACVSSASTNRSSVVVTVLGCCGWFVQVGGVWMRSWNVFLVHFILNALFFGEFEACETALWSKYWVLLNVLLVHNTIVFIFVLINVTPQHLPIYPSTCLPPIYSVMFPFGNVGRRSRSRPI